MIRNKILPTVVLMSMVAFACETKLVDTAFTDATDYYPLETGRYVVYQMDSIIYRETVPTDTISYELKELIGDAYYDNEGKLTYKIERYTSEPGLNEWILRETWSASYSNSRLERNEQNLRFIRLISPVVDGASWEGHVYLGDLSAQPVLEQCNNLEFLNGWDFTYEEVGLPATIGGLQFDETLLVRQTGEQNLIEFNECEERYAKGVGLVYRYFRHYTTQNICPECIWEENVECGYSVKLTVLYHN